MNVNTYLLIDLLGQVAIAYMIIYYDIALTIFIVILFAN